MRPPGVRECDEDYDCVIVGAGASGLAAAKFYRDRFGEDARILIIDPLPDFGGHAQRNEFHVPNAAAAGADLMLLRNGGAVNLDSIGTWNQPTGALLDIPGSYGQPALDMLAFCGVDPNAFPSGSTPGIPSSFGLRPMLLFPAADWGADTLIPNRVAPQPWPEYLAATPFSQAERDGIARIQTDTTTDWLSRSTGRSATAEEGDPRPDHPEAVPDALRRRAGAPTLWYQRNGHGLLGAGVQAISAADAWALGQAGFAGLGLEDTAFPGLGRTPQMGLMPETEPTVLWPDGNASLLRLLVSKLIPAAFPDVDGGRPNQENIVKAPADYTQLDRPGNTVRVRLNSLVYRVEPGRAASTAGGRATTARAGTAWPRWTTSWTASGAAGACARRTS